jgi:hypothetical protein
LGLNPNAKAGHYQLVQSKIKQESNPYEYKVEDQVLPETARIIWALTTPCGGAYAVTNM